MTDHAATHVDGGASQGPVWGILLACFWTTIFCLLYGSIIIAVVALAISVLSWSSFEHNWAVVWSSARLPLVVLALGAAYMMFLYEIWINHGLFGKLTLRLLIGLGGVALPLGISAAHNFNYQHSPGQYRIPAEQLPYLRRLGEGANVLARADMRRHREARETIRRILARRSSLPPRLRLLDGTPSTSHCSRIDLGPQTGALCVLVDKALPSATQVRLDPRLLASPDGLGIADLVGEPEFFCPIRSAIYGTFTLHRNGVHTDRLLHCLALADRAIGAVLEARAGFLRRAGDHPAIPYWVMFLDSLASLVGADYAVLEPLSPGAGAISVLGSLLTISYFVLFASLVLEAAALKHDRQAGPQRSGPSP